MSIELNQSNKHIVWDFWQALENASAIEVEEVARSVRRVGGRHGLPGHHFCRRLVGHQSQQSKNPHALIVNYHSQNIGLQNE